MRLFDSLNLYPRLACVLADEVALIVGVKVVMILARQDQRINFAHLKWQGVSVISS